MKKLTLILALLTLSLQQTKAQDFFFPVQLPESIKTIDTSHVLHYEINGAFKKHTDIAFTPIVMGKEGHENLYLSMVICTMTHEPYFIILYKFNLKNLFDYCSLLLYPRNGSSVVTFMDILRGKYIHSGFLADPLKNKLFPKNELAIHWCLFEHHNRLVEFKYIPYPGSKIVVNIGDALKYVNEDSYDISYEKTLQEKDAQILKQSIQVYEDYIEINGLYNRFLYR
jgi:hypothetical protein